MTIRNALNTLAFVVAQLFVVMDRQLPQGYQIMSAKVRIYGCEACSDSASEPFEWLVERAVGAGDADPYLSNTHVVCPVCATPLTRTMLVQTEAFETETKYFEPCWDETTIVLIDEPLLVQAESCLNGCEHCSSNAEITLDYVLDEVTGCDPRVTEYVLCRPAICGNCHRQVTEKTLVIVR